MSVREKFDPKGLYDVYRVTIAVRDRICGGVPKNPELIRAWVEATTGHADEQSAQLVQQDLDLLVNTQSEKCWIGFFGDEKGIFFPCRCVKACLKQSSTVLGITKQKRGSKQILAEGMEVKSPDGGDRLYFGLKEPSGTWENAIHVNTAQGPRSALRRMDYVSKPKMSFEIWVLKTAAQELRHIGEDDLVNILRHAQENGLGASRSTGEGKFDVIEFQKVS
jgi:hypothetical protein